MLHIFSVEHALAPAFREMVPATQMALLLQMTPGTLAWGVADDGRPVGLVLAVMRPGQRVADLVSLFVEESHRGLGIGRRLLGELEQALQERGYRRLVAEYVSEKEPDARTERFLVGQGFAPSEAGIYVFIGELAPLEALEWYHRVQLPDGFSLFPWQELHEEEQAEIEQGRDAWYPAILSPFDQTVKVDGEHSVGLRFQGRVVGWLITQRLASNQLLYKTMFVKKEFQRLGVGVTMAVEMIRQTQLVRRVPYGMMFVERGNDAMLRMARRRFQPLVKREKVLRRTFKVLGSQS